MIRIEGLAKTYGATVVLRDLSLTAEAGEVVLLLGANGAGKSTLFRCILGLTGYTGRIAVDGLDPLRRGPEVRRRIGYMPQDDGLHADLTVESTLEFYAQLRDETEERTARLLAEARLEDARQMRVDEISGGMRQRLAFALAQIGDPSLLLLDEPTASLDGLSREHLLERLQRLADAGKTVFLSTHADHVALAGVGRALTLRDGKLEEAPPAPLAGRTDAGQATITAPGGVSC